MHMRPKRAYEDLSYEKLVCFLFFYPISEKNIENLEILSFSLCHLHLTIFLAFLYCFCCFIYCNSKQWKFFNNLNYFYRLNKHFWNYYWLRFAVNSGYRHLYIFSNQLSLFKTIEKTNIQSLKIEKVQKGKLLFISPLIYKSLCVRVSKMQNI